MTYFIMISLAIALFIKIRIQVGGEVKFEDAALTLGALVFIAYIIASLINAVF